MDRGAWWDAVHGVEKSWTRLNNGAAAAFMLKAAVGREKQDEGDTLEGDIGCRCPLTYRGTDATGS